MNPVIGHIEVGSLTITTVDNGTLPPEHYAKQAADRIISVAQGTHPAIRDQALDLKASIEAVIRHTVQQAVAEERAYSAHLAEQAGSRDAAAAIRNR